MNDTPLEMVNYIYQLVEQNNALEKEIEMLNSNFRAVSKDVRDGALKLKEKLTALNEVESL
jgi:hypothetical protein